LRPLLADETSTSAANLKRVPELDVANSLWVQQNFAVLPAFVARAVELSFEPECGRSTSRPISQGHRCDQSVDERAHQGLDKAALQPWRPHSNHGSRACRRRLLPTLTGLPGRKQQPPTSRSSLATARPKTSRHELRTDRLAEGADRFQCRRRTSTWRSQLPYAGKKLSALVVMPAGSSLPQLRLLRSPRPRSTR